MRRPERQTKNNQFQVFHFVWIIAQSTAKYTPYNNGVMHSSDTLHIQTASYQQPDIYNFKKRQK